MPPVAFRNPWQRTAQPLQTVAVIPARMQSTRLPDKPLAVYDGLLPETYVGAQLRGGIPVGSTRINYSGFIANALLFGYLNHAVSLYESKYATREDIDDAMRLGCGYPMGPLMLLDLIGLDTAYEILDTMYKQGRDRLHAPSPILKQLVTAGLRGRKSGRGFYTYEAPGSPVVVDGIDMLSPKTDINHARQRIGMVFQSFNLYPHMTALGNVTLALRKVAGKSRAEADEIGRHALERVGLAYRGQHRPSELSGGRRWRWQVTLCLRPPRSSSSVAGAISSS